jgi:hypothetical protein
MTDAPIIELVAEFPAGQSVEIQARAFVYAQQANGEIDGRISVENCDMHYRWIMTGEKPAAISPRRTKIEAVK